MYNVYVTTQSGNEPLLVIFLPIAVICQNRYCCMSNTGSAAPTRILRSITGSGAFPRFSKIGNEPNSQYRFLDAAKMGNEKRNSIGNEPIPVSTQPKSVIAEPVMGTQLRTGGGND